MTPSPFQPRPVCPAAPPKRGAMVWVILVVLVLAAVVAGVFLGPSAMRWREGQQARQQAAVLTATANEHLREKRYDEAEAAARQAMQLAPDYAPARKVLDGTAVLRERSRQRAKGGEDALKAARNLADDDIAAAISAYQKIRSNSSYGDGQIKEAERQIAELRKVTGSLALPKDWPAEATISIDGKAQAAENGLIKGIRLGKRVIRVSREGFRVPPEVDLEFRSSKTLSLPAVTWKPVGGKVSISSTPAGAAVWKNGKDTGRVTPCTIDDVDLGKVSYTLKLAGRFDTEVGGELTAGGTLELNGTLPEQPKFPTDGKQAGERREFNLTPKLRVAFRWCPPGSFPMGGQDPAATAMEKPARTVRLSKGFWLAETEFTQAQWSEVTGESMSTLLVLAGADGRKAAQGPEHPVCFVSWDKICGNTRRDAGLLGKVSAFFEKHGAKEWVADLPTEAQWEYACRAGSKTPFSPPVDALAGVNEIAWHAGNSGKLAHSTGGKTANAWGFRDMHGNVAEWCRDWFQESYAKLPDTDPAGPKSGWQIAVRGGSFGDPPGACRSSARAQAYQTTAAAHLGFRLAIHRREAAAPAPVAAKPKTPSKKPAPAPKKPAPKKPAPKKPAPKKK